MKKAPLISFQFCAGEALVSIQEIDACKECFCETATRSPLTDDVKLAWTITDYRYEVGTWSPLSTPMDQVHVWALPSTTKLSDAPGAKERPLIRRNTQHKYPNTQNKACTCMCDNYEKKSPLTWELIWGVKHATYLFLTYVYVCANQSALKSCAYLLVAWSVAGVTLGQWRAGCHVPWCWL